MVHKVGTHEMDREKIRLACCLKGGMDVPNNYITTI